MYKIVSHFNVNEHSINIKQQQETKEINQMFIFIRLPKRSSVESYHIIAVKSDTPNKKSTHKNEIQT